MKTAKLEKIENRAWTEFNVRGRKMESKIMTELSDKWVTEVRKITGNTDGYTMQVFKKDGGFDYSYNFGDVCA